MISWGFADFDEQLSFLADHFLPRVEWARLCLSFKKLKLFYDKITALGVTYRVGGLIKVLEDRIRKILEWPIPVDQTAVRAFLGTIGITRRWVKNFAELSRPLTRLTGKVLFRWSASEELSFEIPKIKYATKIAVHCINLSLLLVFFIDASGYGAGLAIV